MIHFGFPKPIANNQRPYKDEEWHASKVKHKMDKMFFWILDIEFSEDFYLKKMKLNPSNKAPLFSFKFALLKWVQSATPKALAMNEILLDTHYKFDHVGSMAKLKEVHYYKMWVQFINPRSLDQ
jgi:hypothetical protein